MQQNIKWLKRKRINAYHRNCFTIGKIYKAIYDKKENNWILRDDIGCSHRYPNRIDGREHRFWKDVTKSVIISDDLTDAQSYEYQVLRNNVRKMPRFPRKPGDIQKIYPTISDLTEEKKMNSTHIPTIENETRIDNTKASSYNEHEILEMIVTQENAIRYLETIQVTSKAITEIKAKHHACIVLLVKELESRLPAPIPRTRSKK